MAEAWSLAWASEPAQPQKKEKKENFLKKFS
jgi:hypothetical protein